jgi:hypothetical protein
LALSSTKRALIAVAVMVSLAAMAAGFYLRRLRQPPANAQAGSAPDILSELPADAPVLGYIDVAALRKLQNSPLAALLGLTDTPPQAPPASREKVSAGPQKGREYEEFVRDTGFDYARDLDRATIAFWPTDLAPAANAAGDNPALAIAEGRFDQAKIIAYATRVGGKTRMFGHHIRYIVPGYPDVAFEFPSSTRIVIASGKNSADLLNRPAGSRRDPAVEARIRQVAGAPIFGVARTDHLPSSFYADLATSPQLDRLIRSIQGLSLAGQSQGNHIRVVLDGECDSMKTALEISTLLDGFRLVGAMSLANPQMRAQLHLTPEQSAFFQAFVKEAQVTHQDRGVRITLDVNPAMIGAPGPTRGQPGHAGAPLR